MGSGDWLDQLGRKSLHNALDKWWAEFQHKIGGACGNIAWQRFFHFSKSRRICMHLH